MDFILVLISYLSSISETLFVSMELYIRPRSTALYEALGSKLHFSSAYDLQSDGQSERVIQVLEDMLRSYVINFRGNWVRYLPLAEFAYSNSF
ncbi:Gag protease polyprotein [Gossypium australe]|uniref:Gag protease polyprotein n=1 Tax=Gossypium australe TaxID=47621 RepID=A0A5B6WH26_9ROSI|nr:Gag protease polyprotein [Gossypium australe]